MHISAHGHHTVAMKTDNSVEEDMIIIYITTISNNRRLIQNKNQLNSLLVESFRLRDYVTRAQWSVRDPVTLVTDLMGRELLKIGALAIKTHKEV